MKAICAVLAVGAVSCSQITASELLWTVNGSSSEIQSSNLDGTQIHQIVGQPTAAQPLFIAVDSTAGKFYWTNQGFGTLSAQPTLKSANLDGTAVQTIVAAPVTVGGVMYNPTGVAVDSSQNKLYWTGTNSPQAGGHYQSVVFSGNLDGSELQALITSNLQQAAGIVIDLVHQQMYIADQFSDQIDRANLDGSGFQVLVSDMFSAPRGLALDVADNYLYYVNQSNNHGIYRVHLDGTNPQSLVDPGYPNDISLDLGNGKMYWTNSDGSIQQANLDGSDLQTLVSGLKTPFGIAVVVPEPSGMTLALLGLMCAARAFSGRWRRSPLR